MNRTDRLYAIVEELRATAPRRRSARELAARYEVSVRTIERDICALQQSGVPIYADQGRTGGYSIDPAMTLPPLNFSPAEAVAVAIALARTRGTPFDPAGQNALRKIVSAMSERDASAARDLATRVRFLEPASAPSPGTFGPLIQHAIAERRMLRIGYLDRHGVPTERDIDPMVLQGGPRGWYLVAWCRLRDEARAFRVDRIRTACLTGLPAQQHAYEECAEWGPELIARTPAL